jgi:hypothetical protein
MSKDTGLSKPDLERMVREIEKQGWTAAALDLFGREVALAEHVSNEFARVQHKLMRSCFKGSLDKLYPLVSRLVLEPLLLLDRAHRQLGEGFLPGRELETTKSPAPPGPRRKFARTEFDAGHVRMIRPDLTEFQAQVFLEYRELEIGSAMYHAGWAAMEKLLKDYRPGGES